MEIPPSASGALGVSGGVGDGAGGTRLVLVVGRTSAVLVSGEDAAELCVGVASLPHAESRNRLIMTTGHLFRRVLAGNDVAACVSDIGRWAVIRAVDFSIEFRLTMPLW